MIGMIKANLRNDLRKLSLNKARLKRRLLLKSKKIKGCKELADVAVNSLMLNVYNALRITLRFRKNGGMMVHACKQKCLQEQHKEQRRY